MSGDLQSAQCSWGAAAHLHTPAQPLTTTTAPHSQQDRALPTSRHRALCQGPGAKKVPGESTEPAPRLCAPLVTVPAGWMPQPHCLNTPQEKSPMDLHGGPGHEVPGDGSWLVLLRFIWARGCSAQKGTNKDSYSSPLIIWDSTFNVCKYICVPVLPSPLSWHNS